MPTLTDPFAIPDPFDDSQRSDWEGNRVPTTAPKLLSINDIESQLAQVAKQCSDEATYAKTDIKKCGRFGYYRAMREAWGQMSEGFTKVRKMSEAACSDYDERWSKVQRSVSNAQTAMENLTDTTSDLRGSYETLSGLKLRTEQLSLGRILASTAEGKTVPESVLEGGAYYYALLHPEVGAMS